MPHQHLAVGRSICSGKHIIVVICGSGRELASANHAFVVRCQRMGIGHLLGGSHSLVKEKAHLCLVVIAETFVIGFRSSRPSGGSIRHKRCPGEILLECCLIQSHAGFQKQCGITGNAVCAAGFRAIGKQCQRSVEIRQYKACNKIARTTFRCFRQFVAIHRQIMGDYWKVAQFAHTEEILVCAQHISLSEIMLDPFRITGNLSVLNFRLNCADEIVQIVDAVEIPQTPAGAHAHPHAIAEWTFRAITAFIVSAVVVVII